MNKKHENTKKHTHTHAHTRTHAHTHAPTANTTGLGPLAHAVYAGTKCQEKHGRHRPMYLSTDKHWRLKSILPLHMIYLPSKVGNRRSSRPLITPLSKWPTTRLRPHPLEYGSTSPARSPGMAAATTRISPKLSAAGSKQSAPPSYTFFPFPRMYFAVPCRQNLLSWSASLDSSVRHVKAFAFSARSVQPTRGY